MTKYNISFFDLSKGVPSATLADYGITLNSAASKILTQWKYARIGFDRTKNLIVIAPHNNDAEAPESFRIKDNATFIRISSKDFVRMVSQYCNIPLQPSSRCLAEWDKDETILVIDPKKVLDTSRQPSNSQRPS
ncbi:MAG TPA: hypothetical protein VMW83_11370 [Spirochaetia bacterium]|nr:hypothetical protein [Spirochaetia bacterium]